MTQFHAYLDGEPTKGIFNSLEEAKRGYRKEADAGQNVEIKTVNSPSPVEIWYFDNKIEQWVKGA